MKRFISIFLALVFTLTLMNVVTWPKALQRDSWDYSLGDKQTKA